MDKPDVFSGNSENPRLSELLTQLLQEQVEAHSRGLGFEFRSGEVFPHDTSSPSVISPAQSWEDAILAASFLGRSDDFQKAPPDWPNLVPQLASHVAIPFCLGNFPQMVRQFRPLLEPSLLESDAIQPLFSLPEKFEQWLTKDTEEKSPYLRAALDRLLGNFERADARLSREDSANPGDFHCNEKAALAWHRGERRQALSLWLGLPDSVPIYFNRGLGLLFLGDHREARNCLDLAIAGLPESSAWHHLACLYQTLAEE
ncbi:MAG: hypothetical protein ACKO23_10615 [Gemmataceae bacterium]